MKKVKKDLLFVAPMLGIAVLLFMFRLTHLPAHIILSVLGIGVLVAYTVIMEKEWKLPKLEILTRLIYGIALVSGVIIMNIHGILVLSIIHRASAILFVGCFVFLFVYKLIKNN